MSNTNLFKSLLRTRILVIFFFILTVNVFYTAYLTQSFEEPIRDIGDKMVGSLSDINGELERIVENETIFRAVSDTWLKKFLDAFTTYTSIIISLFAFTIWVVGIQSGLNYMNGSNRAGNLLIAWVIVMLINGIYIAGLDGLGALSIYFDIMINFGHALPYIISPMKEVSEAYYLQDNITIPNFNNLTDIAIRKIQITTSPVISNL